MDLYLFIVFLGLLSVLQIALKLFTLLRRALWKSDVTTEKYGEQSWAVVTGCTDGIGLECARNLASRGFNVVLISRNINKLNQVAMSIQKDFRNCKTRVFVMDFDSKVKPE